jgi:cytochrome c nitrite reductase small subunit
VSWKSFTVQAVLLGAAIGVASGLGSYTFLYARGSSYLTNDPAACANCHVMRDYYDAWLKSSHRSVAVCNDCHTPHSLIPKYMTNYHHSFAFTTGRFPDAIQIKPHNREVTEHACRSCHKNVVLEIEHPDRRGEVSCLRCHAGVGHLP